MTSPVDGVTLVLEASTYAGSVAVLSGRDVVVARDVEMRGRNEERLLPAVAECIASLPAGLHDLQRVVCGAGPGSFTSLRIAASIAKGICHARELELFRVSSLALIVAGHANIARAGRFMSWLDAMRGESYTSVFETAPDGAIPADAPVRIIPRTFIADEARHAGAVIVDGVPRAANAAILLDEIISAGRVNLDSWEPDYGRAAEAQVKWEAAHGRPLTR